MTSDKTRLETARWYVFDARKIVEHQRMTIEQKKRLGVDTTFSENLLKTMEQTLAFFENDLQGLMDGCACRKLRFGNIGDEVRRAQDVM